MNAYQILSCVRCGRMGRWELVRWAFNQSVLTIFEVCRRAANLEHEV